MPRHLGQRQVRHAEPDEVVPAWPTNPSQTREEEGTPASSAAALARNTAGVQLPQQPMPEMTASVPVDFILSAGPATICVLVAAMGRAESRRN